jgi:hypothetical protein
MSKYACNVSGASAGPFQYFISESPWEYRQISAQTQCDILVHIGDERNEATHIDETGPKQDSDYGMQTSLPYVIDLAGIVCIADILPDTNYVKFGIALRIQIEESNE